MCSIPTAIKPIFCSFSKSKSTRWRRGRSQLRKLTHAVQHQNMLWMRCRGRGFAEQKLSQAFQNHNLWLTTQLDMRAEANQFKAVVIGFAIDQNQAFPVAMLQIRNKAHSFCWFSGLGTGWFIFDFFQGWWNKSLFWQGHNNTAHQNVIAESDSLLSAAFPGWLQHPAVYQFLDLICALSWAF